MFNPRVDTVIRKETARHKHLEQRLEAYLVVPLEKNAKPYMKKMLPKTEMANCIYVKIKTLEIIRNNYTNPDIVSLQAMIVKHDIISKKIELKDMKEYGTGGFSKQKIEKDELLIYAGQIGLNSEFDIADTHIATLTPEGIPESRCASISSANTECLAKFLQHLPEDTSTSNNGAVSSNFTITLKFINVNFKNNIYLVPVYVLIAKDSIPAGSILGIDYGKDYWLDMNISPAYFNRQGEALETFDVRCDDVNFQVSIPLTRTGLEDFVRRGYIFNAVDCELLTAESRTLLEDFLKNLSPKSGTTVIKIPSMVAIVSRGKIGKVDEGLGYYVIRKKDDVISAEMAVTFKIAYSDFKNIPMMVLPLAPISAASKEDLLKLVAYQIPFCKISLYQSMVAAKKSLPHNVGTFFKSVELKTDGVAVVAAGIATMKLGN
jgi:hypothetical protein